MPVALRSRNETHKKSGTISASQGNAYTIPFAIFHRRAERKERTNERTNVGY